METDRLSYLLRHEATAHGKEDYKHLAADALESLSAEVESLRATISRLREYVRDCATNWDCDEDAHTYRTTCRKCDAEALLAAMAGGANGN